MEARQSPGKGAVAPVETLQLQCHIYMCLGNQPWSSCSLSSLFCASYHKVIQVVAAPCRYSHLVYNGSVHYWHVARPLQCDKLRHHLLPSQDKLCQVGVASLQHRQQSAVVAEESSWFCL
jgi:hypothetical protein